MTPESLIDRERRLITNRLVDLDAYLVDAKERHKVGRFRQAHLADLTSAVNDIRSSLDRIDAWEEVVP